MSNAVVFEIDGWWYQYDPYVAVRGWGGLDLHQPLATATLAGAMIALILLVPQRVGGHLRAVNIA